MDMTINKCLGALAMFAWSLFVHAQGNSAALVPEPQEKYTDTCKTEVLKFEKNIAFIRSSLGNAAAAKLREKLSIFQSRYEPEGQCSCESLLSVLILLKPEV